MPSEDGPVLLLMMLPVTMCACPELGFWRASPGPALSWTQHSTTREPWLDEKTAPPAAVQPVTSECRRRQAPASVTGVPTTLRTRQLMIPPLPPVIVMPDVFARPTPSIVRFSTDMYPGTLSRDRLGPAAFRTGRC